MADKQPGTLEAIGMQIAKVFYPLRDRVEAGEIMLLLAELGIEFPDSLANDTAFQTAVTGVTDKITQMIGLVKELVQAIKDEDYVVAAEKTMSLIELISGIATDIETIGDEIDAHGTFGGITQDILDEFVNDLPRNLIDYLVISYLQSSIPLLAIFFEFFGLIEETKENEGSTNPALPEYTKKTIRLDRITDFLKSPAQLAKDLYDWGDTDFTGDKLFKQLEKLINAMGLPAVYDESSGTPELDVLMATAEPRTDLTPRGIALTIHETIGTSLAQTITEDKWSLEIGFETGLSAGAGVTIQPDGQIKLVPPAASTTNIEGKAYLKWIAKDNIDNQPLLIVGELEGSRLEAKEISATVEIDFGWNGTNATGTATAEAKITEGKLVIKPGDPDGFLAQVLPPDGFELDFNILLGLSSSKGFYFQGSGTLEFDIPVSISLGPIEILNLTIGIAPGSDFTINLGADIRAMLGPFTAIVENMGMKTIWTFPDDRKGNLGIANLDIGFKPPVGIGLSLDAGVVKGGGYLMLDYDKGQYAGAVELSLADLFGFSAIGIITTKFPDGSEGFSLLLIVNVTFATPIPLSYNFYLSGVGGMIGLHRTINSTALQKGVKEGSIDNILFPENIIANITKIIADLESIFPAKQDQFMLGIMLRITWNTPAILTIEAGLAVEFPNPVKIVIIGVIKCVLPTPDAAIIEINVAFAGIIDFEQQLISFDASIFNSKILTITLEGDMALRISWSDQPDFLVTVGGFHPVYTPSARLNLLPMKRMTVNILSGNPKLVLTAYFAVTTNTIQFGAAIDFSFTFSGFGAYGHFGFDVLIQFSPFHFIAEVDASVAIKAGGSTLFSIGLEFNLEGPTPWHAKGYGSFKIFFVKFKVRFEKTWGEERANSLPSTSVLPLLQDELEKNTNWDTKRISNLPELVTYGTAVSDEEAILVRPNGSLEINQTVVPLDLTMERFGNYKPDDISFATITGFTIGGDEYIAETSDLKNSFAPAAYKDMKDQDKLTAPSYADQNSGIRLAADELSFDYGINRNVQYETILSDFEEEALGLLDEKADFFKSFVAGGDIGKSFLSQLVKNNAAKGSKTVNVSGETYAVVSTNSLTNIDGGGMVFNSRSDADEYLRSVVTADGSKKGKVQVSPVFQMTD